MINNNGVELKSGKGLGPDDSPVELDFEHEVWCLDCNQVIRCSIKILYCPHCGHENV